MEQSIIKKLEEKLVEFIGKEVTITQKSILNNNYIFSNKFI